MYLSEPLPSTFSDSYSLLRNVPKDCFLYELYKLLYSIKDRRIVAAYTDLAKLDMSAHVSSHALIEFPPGVLEEER